MKHSLMDFGDASEAMKKAASKMAWEVAEDIERRMMNGATATSSIGDLSTQNTCAKDPGIDSGELQSIMEELKGNEIEPSLRMWSPEKIDHGEIRWRGHQPYWVPFGLHHMSAAFVVQSCVDSSLDLKASMMRRTADIDSELIRNAEIRALTDPS